MATKKQDVFFGRAPGTALDLPGVYVSPEGGQSVGGIDVRRRDVFTTGGGGSSSQVVQPAPTPQEEAAAEAEKFVSSVSYEERVARAEQERLAVLMSSSQERIEAARAVRSEARERGVDVSTPVKERRFIRQLKKEVEERKEEKDTRKRLTLRKEDIETRTGTISKVPETSYSVPKRESVQNFGSVDVGQVLTQPFITERQIGTFTSKDFKTVPVTEIVYIDPTVSGKAFERPATKAEIKQLRQEQNPVVFVPRPNKLKEVTFDKPIQAVVQGYSYTNLRLRQTITEPVFVAGEKVGITTEKVATGAAFAVNPLLFTNKGTKEFAIGVGEGILTDVREKPLKQVVLYGAGRAAGFAVKGGANVIPKISGSKVVKGTVDVIRPALVNINPRFASISPEVSSKLPIASTKIYSKGIQYGGVALGTQFVLTKGIEAYSTGSARGAGEVIGVATKDVGLVGYGFRKGEGDFLKFQGNIRAGDTGLPEQQVLTSSKEKYPLIEKGQTAGQFKQKFYEQKLPGEIAGTPRGFTATASVWSKQTTIGAGSSEVPGSFINYEGIPTYLRLGKGQSPKLFGSDILYPTNPTLIRLTVKDIGFVPGITSSTTSTTGRYPLKPFISDSFVGSGKALIPFAGEQEAIVAVNTPVKLTQNKFYFTESTTGVKVPIPEYTVLPEGTTGKGVTTLGNVLKASGSSSASLPSSYISPAKVGSGSLLSTSRSSTSFSGSSISLISTPSSSIRTSSSSRLSGISLRSLTSSSKKSSSNKISSSISSSSLSSSIPKSISSVSSRGRSSRINISSSKSYGSSSSLFGSSSSTSSYITTSSGGSRSKKGGFGSLKGRVPTSRGGLFGVEVRRRGKFRPKGRGTLQQAINIGKGITSGTLGATFRITPLSGRTTTRIRTPTGFYQKRGLIFIEKPRYRLSKSTEIKEIQIAKRRKKRR